MHVFGRGSQMSNSCVLCTSVYVEDGEVIGDWYVYTLPTTRVIIDTTVTICPEKGGGHACVRPSVCVCVCVCERERERERDRVSATPP